MDTKLQGWMVVTLLLGTIVYAIAEEITLVTYYPSPRGVYEELRVTERVVIGTEEVPEKVHGRGESEETETEEEADAENQATRARAANNPVGLSSRKRMMNMSATVL